MDSSLISRKLVAAGLSLQRFYLSWLLPQRRHRRGRQRTKAVHWPGITDHYSVFLAKPPARESFRSSQTKAEALKLARKAAPLLDISVSEFMRLRKNEW